MDDRSVLLLSVGPDLKIFCLHQDAALPFQVGSVGNSAGTAGRSIHD